MNPQQMAIRSEFDRLVNMTPEEMTAHYASPASDFASLHPPVAAKLKQRSGKTLGKQALTLKVKETWEDADFEQAASMLRPLKLQLSKTAKYQTEDGQLTPFTIALMNRGHDPRKMSESDQSLYEIEESIRTAVKQFFREMLGVDPEHGFESNGPWTRDVFPDKQTVVVDFDDVLLEMAYTRDEAGTVTIIPGMLEVRKETHYVPVEAPLEAGEFEPEGILEQVAEAEAPNGPKWTGIMIRAGAAKNKAANGLPRIYTPEALKTAVEEGLFDDVPGYQRTDAQHGKEAGTVMAGSWGKAMWDAATGCVKNTFTWLADKYPAIIHQQVKTAIAEGRTAGLPGFSITGNAQFAASGSNLITKILQIRSCDPISFPSAGGAVLAVSESHTKKESAMTMKITDVLRDRKVIVPQALESRWAGVTVTVAEGEDAQKVTEGAASAFMLEQLKANQKGMFDANTNLEAKLAKDEEMLVLLFTQFMKAETGIDAKPPAQEPAIEAVPATQVVSEAHVALLNSIAMDNVLGNSKLDEPMKGMIRKRFEGKAFDPKAVNGAIQEALDLQESFRRKPGDRVSIERDSADNLQTMVNDFFFLDYRSGSDRARVAEAVGDGVISKNYSGTVSSFQKLLENLMPGLDPSRMESDLITEAMDTAMATRLLANGMNASLAYRYSLPSDYDAWRKIVKIVPVSDFKAKYALTQGGFSGWTTIAKSVAYPSLTDSGTLAETYTIVKRGGILGIAFEDVRNDDVGVIQSIPGRLADEAKAQISSYVWGLVTANAAMAIDSAAVIVAAHSNVSAQALSEDALTEAIGFLQAQCFPNSTNQLMTLPKTLAIGTNPTLIKNAYALLRPGAGQANGVASWLQEYGIEVVKVPHIGVTSSVWYLFGDPSRTGIIELGILDNQETPQISQLAEGVNYMWTNDEFQWKVRHAYAGTFVDYKGVVGYLG